MAGEVVPFTLRDTAPEGAPLLTIPGGIGLYRHDVVLDLTLTEGKGFSAQARFEGCFVKLGANGDAFIAQLIPGAQDSEGFDLGFTWDSQHGVTFNGGAALELTIPLRAKLPLVKFDALHLVIAPRLGATSTIPIELSADATASLLGVIDVTVQRMGVVANLHVAGPPPPGAIPIGPLGATIDFKPPSGAGLSINVAGVLNGGGFLAIDSAKGQYSGVLSVNVIGLGVTAIAIINTKPEFSLFAVLTADFRPVGIDLGFGFTINAVGGMLGLHRSADLGALSDAVRNDAISSLMFPADPVANAPRILSDLDRMFPRVHNQFLVGPMLQVGWGKPAGMISLSVGLIIEVPDPKLAIVGVLKVLVPPLEVALLRIQVNFTGSVDFGRKFVRFDASLFDSRLQLYALEGDMAARLRWGEDTNFAVSVGGFNPRYVPSADLEILPMRRVTTNLLPLLDNPRLRMESYYAVTSNTLQHGARIELYAAVPGFAIRGHLGYDLLAQISPLHFEASCGGAVAVIAAGEEILSLGLDLLFAGPSPWHVQGRVKFRVLLVKVTVGIDETFGSADAPAVPDVDVAAEFRRQIADPRNWSATLPGQGHLLVQLRSKLRVAENEILAHPSATLEFTERAIPLKVTLQRFGAAKPVGPALFDIIGMTAGVDLATEPVKTEFAPAQFFELSNDDKMSAPAFRSFDSGLRANGLALVRFGKAVQRDFGYEDGVIDAVAEEFRFRSKVLRFDVDAIQAAQSLGGGALGRSELYRERRAALPSGDEIKLAPGGYRVVDAATLQPAASVAALDNHVAADQALRSLVAASPALAGRLMVVAEHELA